MKWGNDPRWCCRGSVAMKIATMKTSPLPRSILITLAAALRLGMLHPANADCVWNVRPWVDIAVSENESFARVWLYRTADTNLSQTVQYFTVDGPPGGGQSFPAGIARAGMDYVSRRGVATFAIGETATSVDIPVIDNGLLDGVRDLSLVFTNASPGLQIVPSRFGNVQWIRIQDNEIGAALDPSFAPDQSAWSYLFGATALPLPDGRILMSREQQGLQMVMFQPDGRVDVAFSTRLASNAVGSLVALQAMEDGNILARELAGQPRRIIRLLSDGRQEAMFTVTNLLGTAIAQSDGRILVLVNEAGVAVLKRLNPDGSVDPGFKILHVTSVAMRPDGKLLVAFPYSILRLNADGSPDRTFSAARIPNEVNYSLWPRHNGRLLVSNGRSLLQLDDRGALDGTGVPAELTSTLPINGPSHNDIQFVDSYDGRLYMGIEEALADVESIETIVRWNADGVREPNLTLAVGGREACARPAFRIGSAGTNLLVVTGGFRSVDGYPRPGVARLFTNPPERDFRVLTPTECRRSDGVARLRVVRTGPTTHSASVSFGTSDDTAQAGEDYVPRSGTLNFAPLEVSKEIAVPVLPCAGVGSRLSFNLNLSNPSAGYTTIAATSVALIPDLRIAAEPLQPQERRSVVIRARGTWAGHFYQLEDSTDLLIWNVVTNRQAFGNETVFDSVRMFELTTGEVFPGFQPGRRFFRVRGQWGQYGLP